MTLRFTILGCGASTGVPRIDGNWGKCDPTNPKNRRRRASLLIERITSDKRTTALIDTGPDIREQMLSAGVNNVDGVLYSHDHADHTHGIDDLRLFAYARRGLVPVYYNQVTGDLLRQRFDYCFATRPGSSYPPIVRGQVIAPGDEVVVGGAGGEIRVSVYRQHHGDIESLGFRIGGLAYSTDLHTLADEAVPVLAGLDVWIVDALRYTNHPSHFSVGQALEWAERLRPKLTVFSHMTVDLDYDTLRRELPEAVIPAHDGLQFELPADAH